MWSSSTAVGPWVDQDYLHDGNTDKGAKTIRFVPDLPEAGHYEVRVAYTPNPNRATNVPITIMTRTGRARVLLNQRHAPTNAPFETIGTFEFSAGRTGWVEIAADDTNGHVIADAVQWLPSKEVAK